MIVSSEHTIFLLSKNMTCNNLMMGKGYVVMLLRLTINPYKHTRKKYPNMERVKRVENAIVVCHKTNKISQKEVGCIILTRQDFHNDDSPIDIYALDIRRLITTEGSRNLLFSDGSL